MSDDRYRVKRPEELMQDPYRLKHWRFKARLNLCDAADAAGVSSGWLSLLENGRRSAGQESLGKLADAYGQRIEGGCKIEYLMRPVPGAPDNDALMLPAPGQPDEDDGDEDKEVAEAA